MKQNEISSIRAEVENLLEYSPKLRDSDSKLWSRIIANRINTKETSAYQMLCLIATDQLPSYESVSRARRLIQSERPELQGRRRLHRIIAEESVRKELQIISQSSIF